VTQRGNNRQDVFFTDEDRRVFLALLKEQAERFELSVLAYCLMRNHTHLVVVPAREESLSKGLGRANLCYARYVNRLHGRSGHLWQDRFFSCALDEEHLWHALRYVERNPVRAHLVRRAWRYTWSSAAAHSGRGPAAAVLDLGAWEALGIGQEAWSQELVSAEDGTVCQHLCQQTLRGRPLGSDSFVSKVEALVGRRLRPNPIGRPRRQRGKKHGEASTNL
jgi:putative transposase